MAEKKFHPLVTGIQSSYRSRTHDGVRIDRVSVHDTLRTLMALDCRTVVRDRGGSPQRDDSADGEVGASAGGRYR